MKIYLARHGEDDNTVRGGWSDTPLTETGIKQAFELAEKLTDCNIGKIISSDLTRARQTAEIIAKKLNVGSDLNSDFREVNNGELAGMDNKIADEKYPGIYWRTLEWNEHYPCGESPREFYERISAAWNKLTKSADGYDKNILLVTHGGVINIIRCLINNEGYTNKKRFPAVPSAETAFVYEKS